MKMGCPIKPRPGPSAADLSPNRSAILPPDSPKNQARALIPPETTHPRASALPAIGCPHHPRLGGRSRCSGSLRNIRVPGRNRRTPASLRRPAGQFRRDGEPPPLADTRGMPRHRRPDRRACLLIARRGASKGASTDYMEAVTIGDGVVPVRQSLWRSISSLFTISSGGSIGREGSMVQLAALCASLIGRWAHFDPPRLRLLVACARRPESPQRITRRSPRVLR